MEQYTERHIAPFNIITSGTADKSHAPSKLYIDFFSTQLNAQDIEALDLLDSITSNADGMQAQVLSEILTQSSETEYLRALGLGGSTDRQNFKDLVPLCTYEDIAPLISRIAQGDKSPIITSLPILLFFCSSGTSSGQPKLIPIVNADNGKSRRMFNNLLVALVRKSAGEMGLIEDHARKWLNFLFIKPEYKTPGSFPVQTFVSNICKSPEFQSFAEAALVNPIEAVQCEDVSQSMYCQLLCGLIRRSEVACVGVAFASGALRVVHCLQEWWQELVEDIRRGTVSTALVSDPIVRRAVESTISASGGSNPPLAEEVMAECMRQPRWQAIIRRLWPYAKYLATITTGAMEQYVPMLEFYCGDLPLVCSCYGSSEAVFGVNLAPFCRSLDISYTFLPNMAYFEFLPVSEDNDKEGYSPSSAALVDLVDVKVGLDYEVVATTYAGLYRYRIGDVIRVTGFYNKVPQVRVVGRRSVILSIDADKTEEETLRRAVKVSVSGHLEHKGWHLVDYTSCADSSTLPGHYVLFWELCRVEDAAAKDAELPDARDMEACCLTIEESLDYVYRWCRVRDKTIGPLEIRVVTPGTFDALMEFLCVQKGSSYSQYKTPKCVNSQQQAQVLDILSARVCISATSQRCPSCPDLVSE